MSFEVLFWLGAATVVYTFAGYPVVISLLAALQRRMPRQAASSILPTVSVVVVAYNERSRLPARLENLLTSEFPPDKLEIIVVSDGSTDGTEQSVPPEYASRVRMLVQPSRLGKAAGLNRALASATGEIVVFADARQRFAPNAINRLVNNFSDPKVGAVSGNYSMNPAATNIGGGVDFYWRLEKKVREAESRVDSSIGCTGAIYAIRRGLFQEIPGDTILDDVVIPMQIALQGSRVVFEPSADSFDPQASEPAVEQRRKRRTLAGNFQMLFRHPQWLFPWKNRLWWQLISHKYLRIAAPLFLGMMIGGNIALMSRPFYRILLAGQCAFYGLAAFGGAFPSARIRLLSMPAGFCFLNLMTVGGFWNYLRGAYRDGWR